MDAFAGFTSQYIALEAMVTALQATGLPGPVLLVGIPEFVGRGTQFVVYKQIMASSTYASFSTREVAVKHAKFELNPDQQLSLSDPSVRKHLHNMYLEIASLTLPDLREHPNIARLFAWGYDTDAYHTVPMLVMELAYSDLEKFLEEASSDTAFATRCFLCQDIGLGLDAIHECELIHGDLKPQNILVYKERYRHVAKLADFGLCVSEFEARSGVRLGGTQGWQAPEVVAGDWLKGDALIKADNFSFGLLIWKVSLHPGDLLPLPNLKDVSVVATKEFQTAATGDDARPCSVLQSAVEVLLAYTPEDRPLQIADLLEFEMPHRTK